MTTARVIQGTNGLARCIQSKAKNYNSPILLWEQTAIGAGQCVVMLAFCSVVSQPLKQDGIEHMKVGVRIICLFGSALWAAVLFVVSKLAVWGDGAGTAAPQPLTDILWSICPLVYFAICFGTTFAKRKGSPVLIWGIIAHVILACFVVRVCVESKSMAATVVMFLIPSLVATAFWIFMYLELEKSRAQPA